MTTIIYDLQNRSAVFDSRTTAVYDSTAWNGGGYILRTVKNLYEEIWHKVDFKLWHSWPEQEGPLHPRDRARRLARRILNDRLAEPVAGGGALACGAASSSSLRTVGGTASGTARGPALALLRAAAH